MTMPTPETVERNNQAWWDKHSPEYGHTCKTPLDVSGKDYEIGNDYGRFIYCPMPVSGHTRWAFADGEGMKRFLADVEAGKLRVKAAETFAPRSPAPAPVKPSPAASVAAAEPDPLDDFDILGDDEPVTHEITTAQTVPAAPADDDEFDILPADDDEFDILSDDPAPEMQESPAVSDDPELDEDGFPI